MNPEQLENLLQQVKAEQVSINEAIEQLRHLPFEDIGFARVDHHRQIRCGFAEVIYCPGKTDDQIAHIFEILAAKGNNVLATRAEEKTFEVVKANPNLSTYTNLRYEQAARMIVLEQKPLEPSNDYIAIVTAGTADIPVASEAEVTCRMLNQQTKMVCDVGVAGIHRLLNSKETLETLRNANVVIVVAGMEGALASVIGGLVDCPVVAVPTSVGYGASFEGLAALLAMLNSCAAGISVVNIDNGFGAGYSASLINMKIRQKGNCDAENK